MTSLWEGLPISTIEAMCCGLAPVVNDVDGQREIVKDNINGFLIKPYDINSMTEKILFLANNNEIRKSMGKTAKESINEENAGIEEMDNEEQAIIENNET